jgi:hypothetical protein
MEYKMASNPYKNQNSKAFWSKSVSSDYNPQNLISDSGKLLTKNDKVVSAGSCFASNLVPYIESAGLTYVRTEQLPSIFSQLGENLGYANFSAAYGNIYTASQLNQLYDRSLGKFNPIEDRWIVTNQVIDPFRPGLRFPALSSEEFDLQTSAHLLATKKAFEAADVFVFTLGLTEAWRSKIDSATYPACPGTIAGEFSEEKYEFKNFSVEETVADTSNFIENLRRHNPKVRFILSVSPVPLVATATNRHVLRASTYSKSVLRVAAEEVSTNFKDVTYFPAYEIITGPQAPENFFESDKRNVSDIGVSYVMRALFEASGLNSKFDRERKESKFRDNESKIQEISTKIATADCDEVMLDETL